MSRKRKPQHRAPSVNRDRGVRQRAGSPWIWDAGSTGVQIRLAEDRDLPAALECLKAALSDQKELPPTCSAIVTAAAGGDYLRAMSTKLETGGITPGTFTLVAVDGDEVVGTALFGPPYRLIENVAAKLGPSAEVNGWLGLSKLYGVATLPQARGRGIGGALVRAGRDFLFQRVGVFVVHGSCQADLGPWYAGLGFEVLEPNEPADVGQVAFGCGVMAVPGVGESMFVAREPA